MKLSLPTGKTSEDILRTFGLNVAQIKSFQLNLIPSEHPSATVEFYLDAEKINVLKRNYILMEVEDDKSESN